MGRKSTHVTFHGKNHPLTEHHNSRCHDDLFLAPQVFDLAPYGWVSDAKGAQFGVRSCPSSMVRAPESRHSQQQSVCVTVHPSNVCSMHGYATWCTIVLRAFQFMPALYLQRVEADNRQLLTLMEKAEGLFRRGPAGSIWLPALLPKCILLMSGHIVIEQYLLVFKELRYAFTCW
jgi:hypothetical protein